MNIKCKAKGCNTLTTKYCNANMYEGEVKLLLCDKHCGGTVETLPFIVAVNGELRAKCFSCGETWVPETFKETRRYTRPNKKFGDVPISCAKCRSRYWKVAHKAVMRGWR